MTKVEEIEHAVDALSQEEFRKLFDWMRQRGNDLWDHQFEQDALSGKLDELGDAALNDVYQGKCSPL